MGVAVMYEGQPVGRHRMDLVIGGRLMVELKTVEELNRSHDAQVRAYLKATGLPVALLVNFAKAKADYRRIEANPHILNHPHISDSQRRAAEDEN
jgi:GxxExxY protein